MSIFDKANSIEITKEDLQDAKSTAAFFKDENVKKRAFANVLAARCALKLLFSINVEATNLYSMYSINRVLEKYDIADVYAGNLKIDARIVNDETEIFLPKSHFDLDIAPDLYVVLKLQKDMSSVDFLGCINPDEVDRTKCNKDYIFVDDEVLYSFKIFKNLLKNAPASNSYSVNPEDYERASNLIVPFEDNDIYNQDEQFLMKQLSQSVELRQKTIEFENFEFVSKKVVIDETVYGDSVLGLVGSEKLYDHGELDTDVNLDELADSTVDDFVEPFEEAEQVSSIPDFESNDEEGIDLDDVLNEFDLNNQVQDEEEEPVLNDDFDISEFGLDNSLPLEELSNADLDQFVEDNILVENEFHISEADEGIIEDDLHPQQNNLIMDSPLDEFEDVEEDPLSFEEETEDIQDLVSDETAVEEEEEPVQEDDAFDFDNTDFHLDEIGGFSLDGEDEDEEEDNLPQSEPEQVEEDIIENVQDEDDGMPTLKILDEDENTYNKKIYKVPNIDDVNLETVNLDELDDYDSENEQEESEDESDNIDDMLSDVNEILSDENIDTEQLLGNEELSEFIGEINVEDFDKNENPQVENLQLVQENFENAQNPQPENPTQDAGMSLDDFLNSSSFDEMSSVMTENANILENNNINNTIEDNNNYNAYVQENNFSNDFSNDYSQNIEPEKLLTNEEIMADSNNESLYGANLPKTPKPSNVPKLLLVLALCLCGAGYTNKDAISDWFGSLDLASKFKKEAPAPEINIDGMEQPIDEAPDAADNPIPNLPQPADMPEQIDAPPEVPTAPEATAPAPAPQQNTQAPVNGSNRISKISWEVPEYAANNQKIRKYLQIAGRTMKLSLQNDLLVATELPYSRKVMIELKVAPSGNLIGNPDFVISSGSKQIDNIISQSVKDTLKYVRPPLGEIQSPNSNFTLIINF